jgi:hypothetical protein
VPTESAQAVNAALQADVPVALDPAATTDASFGTVPDPAAPPPAEPPVEGETGETPPDGTAPPETSATALPSDVTGQTAADVRCASANEG